MNNHQNISISRYLFVALCVAAGILAIAFVIALIQFQSQPTLAQPTLAQPTLWGGEKEPKKHVIVQESNNPVPIEGKFLEFLKRGKYSGFMLVNLKGQARIIGLDGRDKMPCGEIVGSEIRPFPGREDCPSFKNIKLTHVGLLQFLVFDEGTKDPICHIDGIYVC
ncbi:MAG: hypothetical protein ACREV4_15425 [Gammaproteobacteria bacterium]